VQKYKLLGLFIFTAIPLSGLGAWTGALIATLMDMRFKKAMLSLFAGVCCACIIITVLFFLFSKSFGVRKHYPLIDNILPNKITDVKIHAVKISAWIFHFNLMFV